MDLQNLEVGTNRMPLEFADVFLKHAPYAWRCLRRLGVSPADADDVCQEVFLIVHRRLSDYDGRASVRAWILGICVRKAADYRRLAHRKREQATDHLPEAESDFDPAAGLDRQRALRWLDEVLGEIDSDKRAAFVLYEIEGLTLQEISGAMGCALQTAYSRLAAARSYVEAAMKRRESNGRGHGH